MTSCSTRPWRIRCLPFDDDIPLGNELFQQIRKKYDGRIAGADGSGEELTTSAPSMYSPGVSEPRAS